MKTTLKAQLFLVVLIIATFFVSNAALPTDIMESRNLVTAQEIAHDGNWLVPTMNGELRLEKPPLPTWVAAAICTVAPDSLSAQRAAAGVMGIVWTLFLYLFARHLSGSRTYGFATVLVFLTCYHIVLMGRTATWDIYCHAFMMGAIYFLCRGLSGHSSHQYRYFPLAGLFMGLSFLSKGPVSFYALLLPAIVAYCIFYPCSLRHKWGGFILMILIALAVGSWWYIYLLLFEHNAVEAVIHKESGAWTGHNVRPWYYYWRFFTETGIWAILMLAALFVPYWRKHIERNRLYTFSITFTLFVLVLLSLMPEKKIRYLLPIMAPSAMTIACLLLHVRQATDKVTRYLFKGNGILVAIIVEAVGIAPIVKHWLPVGWAIFLAVAFTAVAVYIIYYSVKQARPIHFAYGVGAAFILIECFLLAPIGRLFGNPQEHSIRATRHIAALQGVNFYHPQNEDKRIELVFEAGRKITPINLADSNEVKQRLPFALVSCKPVSQEMPAAVLRDVDTLRIDRYDDNKHPKTNSHYTPDFINYVTLIKSKK